MQTQKIIIHTVSPKIFGGGSLNKPRFGTLAESANDIICHNFDARHYDDADIFTTRTLA